MPDPKVTAGKATEAPVVEEEKLPVGDAPFSTEPTDEAAAAEQEEKPAGSEEAEEIAKEIKPGESQEESQEEEKVDEVEEILKEDPEDKSNVQKRIDALVAENKALKARQAELEKAHKEKPAGEKKDKPDYTPAELRTALKKALEEGDANLAMDIIEYRQDQLKEELIKMYNDEKEVSSKQAKAIQDEWTQAVDAYKDYADTKKPEIWPNSHKDLNLQSATSLLYQVAMALYWSDDPAKVQLYRGQPGGQKLAVADALTHILRKKAVGKDGTKVKVLQKKLLKEKAKKSPVSGGGGGEEKPLKKPLTIDERVAEVIAERRQFHEERQAS